MNKDIENSAEEAIEKLSATLIDGLEVEVEDGISLEEALEVVEFEGRPPMISLGLDFKDQPAEDRARYLHALASTMNHAADLLQKERNALLEVVEQHKTLAKNAENQITIQKTINQNLMDTLNEQTQGQARKAAIYEEKIRNLETELNKLRGRT